MWFYFRRCHFFCRSLHLSFGFFSSSPFLSHSLSISLFSAHGGTAPLSLFANVFPDFVFSLNLRKCTQLFGKRKKWKKEGEEAREGHDRVTRRVRDRENVCISLWCNKNLAGAARHVESGALHQCVHARSMKRTKKKPSLHDARTKWRGHGGEPHTRHREQERAVSCMVHSDRRQRNESLL